MLSAEYRNIISYVQTHDEWLSFEALAERIVQSSGKELLPLFKHVLGPLLRPEISSIQLDLQGTLSVFQMLNEADRQHRSGDQFDEVEVCRVIHCDLTNYKEFPSALIQSLVDFPLLSSGETLGRLVRHFSQAGYALSMGLVTVESNHFLCIEADAKDMEEELIQAQSAIQTLLDKAKSYACQIYPDRVKILAEQVIQRLIHTPTQGMVDGSANYWDEIAGFTDDEESLPFKGVDDIRTLATEAVESISSDEQFLVALQQDLSDGWVHTQLEKREGEFKEEGFEWEPESLVEDVAKYVIEQAIGVAEYQLLRDLPDTLGRNLSSIAEIKAELPGELNTGSEVK